MLIVFNQDFPKPLIILTIGLCCSPGGQFSKVVNCQPSPLIILQHFPPLGTLIWYFHSQGYIIHQLVYVQGDQEFIISEPEDQVH